MYLILTVTKEDAVALVESLYRSILVRMTNWKNLIELAGMLAIVIGVAGVIAEIV